MNGAEPACVGRDEVIAGVVAALRRHGRVTVCGPAGIGKTVVLDRVAGAAAEDGVRVLVTRPVDGDVPYSGLVELLSAVDPEVLERGPPPQREALCGVLRRCPLPEGGIDSLGVRVALAGLLDRLAAVAPVLVVLDNLQWLDRTSLAAVDGALRVVRSDSVRVLTAERGPAPATDGPLIRLEPLAFEEVAELIVGLGLPFRWLGQVYSQAGGNPAAVVATVDAILAMGRRAGPPESVPVTGALRRVVGAWLADVGPMVLETLLLAGLARKPTVTVLNRIRPGRAEDDLAVAASAGLVTVSGEVLRFAAGAIPAVLAEQAGEAARRAAHELLADAVDDSVEAVWHRALATRETSERLGSTLRAAAVTCRECGDHTFAAELGLLAVRRMPGGNRAEVLALLVDVAENAGLAGHADLARRAAVQVLAGSRHPADRVRVRLALIDSAGQDLAGTDELFIRADIEAAGDQELLAAVRLRAALKAHLTGQPLRAAEEAGRAARLSRDDGVRAAALTMRARMERGLGDPAAEDTLAEASALGSPMIARFLAARHALFDDRLAEALEELLGLLPAVETAGATDEIGEVLRCLVEVEARLGHSGACLEHAARLAQVRTDAGMSPGLSWYVLALAESVAGDFDRAARLARLGAAATEEDHDVVFLPRNLSVLGLVSMVTGDAAAAVPVLRRVQRLEVAQGIVDPSILRWHGDLAEALAAVGEDREAAELVAAARPAASDRPGVLAALDRAQAAVCVAGRDLAGATTLLEKAAARFAELGLRVEHGRTLLTLGRLLRSRRRGTAARAAVSDALGEFTALGARPWIRLARYELERLGVRSDHAVSTLTEAEAELAGLVAAGLTNREAASRLVLSVKTVEGRLTRVYRKLGVASRAQLVGLLRGTDPVRITRGNDPAT
ncbi:LuxR family transcriptional regulator [Amycolatopsis suaedae]|uniref:Helix-turn-helix transcriptional regulator n=1 Tax=Amycolatopsis suaedae TaxID=2510978 RepID=A0A4Q7J2C1_9PSEU|nr:LuxR family transcriptional regulator [Amycolatopsis suaedae]RZQ61039.1 helix-turn-helix transcriptional regulator [Amycolatopsis suaedae]